MEQLQSDCSSVRARFSLTNLHFYLGQLNEMGNMFRETPFSGQKKEGE